MLVAAPAHAIVVTGGVTGGGGSFQQLTIPFTESTPDNTVGADNFDVQTLFAFNEGQNILVTSPLTADVGLSPVPTGTIVASHYVFYDPSNGSIQGFVEFDAAVLAITTSTATLAASDFLLNDGVTYLNPSQRGLEPGDTAVIDSGNPNRILVDFSAGSAGDYVRVLTAVSPGAAVPGPATLVALAGGLLLAVVARRR